MLHLLNWCKHSIWDGFERISTHGKKCSRPFWERASKQNTEINIHHIKYLCEYRALPLHMEISISLGRQQNRGENKWNRKWGLQQTKHMHQLNKWCSYRKNADNNSANVIATNRKCVNIDYDTIYFHIPKYHTLRITPLLEYIYQKDKRHK